MPIDPADMPSHEHDDDDDDDDDDTSSDDDDDDDSDDDDGQEDHLEASKPSKMKQAHEGDDDDGDNDDDDDDDEDEDVDEATLTAFDKRLSAMFRQMKQQKQLQRDSKMMATNLRLRVLGLVDVYIRKRQLDMGTLSLLKPLYLAIRESDGHGDLEAFCARSFSVFTTSACKVRSSVEPEAAMDFGALSEFFVFLCKELLGLNTRAQQTAGSDGLDSNESEHDDEHENDDDDDDDDDDDNDDKKKASKTTADSNKKGKKKESEYVKKHLSTRVSQAAMQGIGLVLRVLEYHGKLEMPLVRRWLQRLVLDFVHKRKTNVSPTALTNLVTRFPAIAWRANLVAPLCHKDVQSREFVRIAVLQLLNLLFRLAHKATIVSSKHAEDSGSVATPLTIDEITRTLSNQKHEWRAQFLSALGIDGKPIQKPARLPDAVLALRGVIQTHIACLGAEAVRTREIPSSPCISLLLADASVVSRGFIRS